MILSLSLSAIIVCVEAFHLIHFVLVRNENFELLQKESILSDFLQKKLYSGRGYVEVLNNGFSEIRICNQFSITT